MFSRRPLARTNLAAALLFAAALLTLAGSSAHAQPPGIKALFIGHSFFRPFAEEMPFHATQAGIVGHTQNVVFRGGANGAPEALWNDPVTRAEIQGYLDAGDVELFGMTASESYPTLTGYINWFDYALAQNPNTRFMLALPWLGYPASYTAAAYESAWHAAHTGPWHHDLVDTLRALYPGVEIFCNPYGQSGPELRLLFDAGNLPGITAVQGPAATSLHTDTLGHAGHILKDLGELVWLNRIYDIDLLTYGYSPPWATDLNAIAQAIMDAHNATYGLAHCQDLIDNDGDGLVDLADPGCNGQFDQSEDGNDFVCDNGLDDDGDGLVDFRVDGLGDPVCTSVTGTTEVSQCQDGLDNDNLFGIDFDGGESIFGPCAFGFCPPGVSDPDGDGVADPDPQCASFANNREAVSFGCGLGPELLVLLPLLVVWRQRRVRLAA